MSKYIIDIEKSMYLEVLADPLSSADDTELRDECTPSEKWVRLGAIRESDCPDFGNLDPLFEEVRLYEKIVKGLEAGGMSANDAEELIEMYEATIIESFFSVRGSSQQCEMMMN